MHFIFLLKNSPRQGEYFKIQLLLERRMFMDILDSFKGVFQDFIRFFQDIWNEFYDFLLQFLPKDILNVFLMVIAVGIVLFLALAIMNRK